MFGLFNSMQMAQAEYADRLAELRQWNELLIEKLEEERELIAVLDAAYPEIVRDCRWAVARKREAEEAEKEATTMTLPVTLEDADRVLRAAAKKHGRLADYEKLGPGDRVMLQIEALEKAMFDAPAPKPREG